MLRNFNSEKNRACHQRDMPLNALFLSSKDPSSLHNPDIYNLLMIPSLEKICNAFGITLSQFFAESEMPYTLTKTQAQLLEASTALSEEQQLALIEFIKTL